jgi:DNA-binding transcriptional LysR family regulator
VKAGGVSRAATELGADQSTVSRRISALESELGVRLLHPNGRGVTPPDHGRMLLERPRQSGPCPGAAPSAFAQPTIARMIFGPLAKTLAQSFPKTRLRFVEGLASHILEQLADGDLDIALLYLPEQTGAWRFEELLTEGLRVIAHAASSLEGDELAAERLGDIGLILPSTHHGLRILAASLAARHGFSLKLALEYDGSIAI